MTIDDGVAYGEPFQKATASLRFDGTGVRLDDLKIAKDSGTVTGAAFVGWDSTYSFNADGRRIPVERLAVRRLPARAAVGPRRVHRHRQRHVRVAAQRLPVPRQRSVRRRGRRRRRSPARWRCAARELSGEIDAASPRLAITGTGRIALTPQADAELTFRFHDSSLDPVRPAVRAEAVAVHHRRRERRDPRRRASSPTSITCSSTARSTRSTCGCSTTR